jgi:small subunit ribosomal protein S1
MSIPTMLGNRKKNKKEDNLTMDFLLRNVTLSPPKQDDLVEGAVLKQKENTLFLDLSPYGTGIVYGREFNNAKDLIKPLQPGDLVTAKVIEPINEAGYIELSLKEAGQEIVWREAEEAKKNQTIFSLPVLNANKGGLILEWKNIQGFLPASQLKTGHYPRVEDGDKAKILEELKKLVGKKLNVVIFDCDSKEKKLIFSEKETETENLKKLTSKYKVGDVVEGVITGIVDFGVFVKIEDGLEGLAHLSELDWGLVENPAKLFKVGDKVPAQIIGIKDGKISLSIKALKPNPWQEMKEKYKKGKIVSGVVVRINKYGALVNVEEGIAGLVHVSEFESEEDMKKKIELGKSYKFEVGVFDPNEQKLILHYLQKE